MAASSVERGRVDVVTVNLTATSNTILAYQVTYLGVK